MDENKDKACHHHSPGIYQPRHPEKTVLYQILQENLETWITQKQENGAYVSSHVEKDFREYLKCGLLCSALIHENDREGLERLIRYCARPPFSLERITKQSDGSIIYRLNKPLANGQTLLRLTSLELIDKLAALIPPPRIHRHRYYGVLAPNSPFRASVTAMAGQSLEQGAIKIQIADKNNDPVEQAQEDKPKRPPNRYLWAMLLARIYNLFPLLCPQCGAEMQVIAVIQDKPVINKILKSVGEVIEPPVLRPEGSALGVSPARGPPSWDDYNQDLSVAENEQSIPDFEFNQCVSW
ncbi:MAG: hypothetical protein GY694_22830 [Gammaproteobacteria bacterium]|nr:hypothetical protein [Gammaproteobacteria bacterium]